MLEMQGYHRQLDRFLDFVKRKRLSWGNIFTFETLESFQKVVELDDTAVVVELSRHLVAGK